MESWNKSEVDKRSVFDALAAVLKALANGRRLELIEVLAQGEYSVEAVASMVQMQVTTTSAHLQRLKRTGLVRTRRQGTSIYYRLADDDVARLFLAAKSTGLKHSPELGAVLSTYLRADPQSAAETIDPSAVTSDMTVLDVRPVAEFDAGHFPSAICIPLDELEERHHELPVGKPVVVYCRGELCRLARQAAHWLRSAGYEAKAMDEGIIEWRATKEFDVDIA